MIDTPARSPRRWTNVKRGTEPIVLDPAPAWLSEVPESLLRDHKRPNPDAGLLGWLRGRGVYARPSLADVEAERHRRGLRPGVIVSEEAAPRRVVLPMPSGYEYESPAEARAVARANRERVLAALGDRDGASMDDLDRLGREIARPRREEREVA